MKRDIASFVARCLTYQKVKIEHQKPARLLQHLDILEWKWDSISMDFVVRLPKTPLGYDAAWVIVDRPTKSTYILPIRISCPLYKLAQVYIQEIVRLHGIPINIVSDRDPRFTSKFGYHYKKPQVLNFILVQLTTLKQMVKQRGLFRLKGHAQGLCVRTSGKLGHSSTIDRAFL